MGHHAHQADARWKEAEKAVVSLHSSSDAARANLEVTHDVVEARREEAEKVIASHQMMTLQKSRVHSAVPSRVARRRFDIAGKKKIKEQPLRD
ncbi:hypothetical protein ACLOJK_006008 [Asimina triloba]